MRWRGCLNCRSEPGMLVGTLATLHTRSSFHALLLLFAKDWASALFIDEHTINGAHAHSNISEREA